MRLGEVLGMAISDFVMGRGGTAYVEVVPRPGNANGARVKMMRPRRIMSARIWSGCSPTT